MGRTPEISGLNITGQQLVVQLHHCGIKMEKLLSGIFSATEGGVNRLFRGIIMPAVNQPIGRLTLGRIISQHQ